MKWYVVNSRPDDDDEDLPSKNIWTVSTDPNEDGWMTDFGFPGYGITKDQAEELANGANLIPLAVAWRKARRAAMANVTPETFGALADAESALDAAVKKLEGG